MSNSAMTVSKRMLICLACLAGAFFFLWAVKDLGLLLESSIQFRLHHEMTTPFAFALAKIVAGLAMGVFAAGWARRENPVIRFPLDVAAMGFTAILLVAVGYVLDNETFFSLYDYKGFPVHPTEIFIHPYGGWMTVADHLGICALGAVGCGVYLLLTRGSKG
jgi:hypothetical protein